MRFDLNKIIKNKDITKLEYQVLEYIIDNIDSVVQQGVRGIAKENFTSTSTIMRLAKKLGYKGFIDMVYNLTPLVKMDEAGCNDRVSPLEGVDVNFLLKFISEDELNMFLQILKASRNKFLFIYAAGFSKIIAEYLNKKLLVSGLKSIIIDSIGSFENNLDDMEVLIIISKSGETKEALEKVKMAKERGKVVISFTKEVENSISKLSDVNLKVYDMHKLDDRNSYPNTFFPNVCMLIEYLIFLLQLNCNERV